MKMYQNEVVFPFPSPSPPFPRPGYGLKCMGKITWRYEVQKNIVASVEEFKLFFSL